MGAFSFHVFHSGLWSDFVRVHRRVNAPLFMHWMGQRRTLRRKDEAKTTMNWLKMLAAALLMLCSVIARAASITVGDFSYSYDLSTKEATLTSYKGTSAHVTIPSSFMAAENPKVTVTIDGSPYRTNAPAANETRSVAECYVLGIDPEDPMDDFRITHFEIVDGEPVFTFSHDRDGSGNPFTQRIRKKGKAKLSDGWSDVPPGGDPSFRFFKVVVELP